MMAFCILIIAAVAVAAAAAFVPLLLHALLLQFCFRLKVYLSCCFYYFIGQRVFCYFNFIVSALLSQRLTPIGYIGGTL